MTLSSHVLVDRPCTTHHPKWKPQDTHHDVVVNPYTLTLAAGDTSGDVIIWNVTKGELKSTFSGNGRSVRGKLKTINFLPKLA